MTEPSRYEDVRLHPTAKFESFFQQALLYHMRMCKRSGRVLQNSDPLSQRV